MIVTQAGRKPLQIRNQVAPAGLEDILASHLDVVEAAVCATFDSSQQKFLSAMFL